MKKTLISFGTAAVLGLASLCSALSMPITVGWCDVGPG